jgi:predicted nucleotidyltransferase
VAEVKDDALLAEMVRRMVEVYRPERIYLFGPDSDYDLMIVVPDDAPAALNNPDAGYHAMEGLPRSGDFLVWSRGDFEKRLHLKASLPATIVREGKLLYAG